MRIIIVAAVSVLIAGNLSIAQDARQRNSRGYPPNLPGAQVETYKTIGDTKLNLYVYEPADLKAGDRRPAIVFFFGGGWRSGSPQQFVEHCKYLASRGMLAITSDYRVASRHNVKAVDCLRDAKSAIRWVRSHADQLHVDPQRIVAAGGSAGGHLAAATGTIMKFDEPTEDSAVSSVPNAMILFNPALVLAPAEGVEIDQARLSDLEKRTGVEPVELSPYHHITSSTPPTAIFHGTADRTVPHATAAAFEKAMKAAGNPCTLYSYEGQGHGFFNYGRGDGKMFSETLAETDRFLAQLGYLQGSPTVAKFVESETSKPE